MKSSLWFRLMGVYLVVIAAGLAVVVAAANAASARQFDLFVTSRGQQWTKELAPQLEAYYAERRSWEGAGEWFGLPFGGGFGPGPRAEAGGGMMGGGHVPGMMGGTGEMMGRGMWGAMGLRLLLVDSDGLVVADTEGALAGDVLASGEVAGGTPLLVAGERVGTLVGADVTDPVAASVTSGFVGAINRAVGLAALVAGGLALALGTLLSRRITRPLVQMSAAAARVAAGDLEARVPAGRQDELGQLARSFNQMADGLQGQQALRRQMVADIAHELRTPISVMQGTLEAMLDGILSPEAGELRGLHDETLHLARLVDDLRTLSLADEGQLALEREPLDVGEVVRGVAERMEVIAGEQGVELVVEVAATPTIPADAQRLAQVFTNLVDNGLRYTPRGGEVRVLVTADGHAVKVAVTDNGPGIPPEALPHVFDRFWRADKSRSRAGGGSGLGLAIARQLVEAHGGSATVESQMGAGTTFTVSLPLKAG